MLEFVVIVESSADARTATKLAERVLVERIDWLETELLQNLFQWSGLEAGTEHSCWKDISAIVDRAKQAGLRIPKFLGHTKTGALKADGAAAMKILNLVRVLQKTRPIRAVLFIRDLDNQPERREGIEQARSEHFDRQPKLEIILGAANRMREAWVLNGFVASHEETRLLEEIKARLNFDPCEEPHKLRSNSWEELDRQRNPKFVLESLTSGNYLREQQCWEETSLEILQARGIHTGLTAYLQEVEKRLIPIILE
ncbi:hypothetical protein [Leptolyngbya sp. FACHB-17]|uniref:hypothetical protein n=1 Tax=unclassified Leptolyngbya TaxID=2650499 RepID=UPI001680F8CB|nr:hypothetical protein [Leptolyngbya sp. FACHB-17]MBD2082066.1 hypothetical protein [Leptolyngbya sp. FACHB-17]